jgi:hypothetical protein
VGEELVDGESGDVGAEAREVLADRVVECELALLNQLGDGYGGEHFANRSDVESRVGVVGLVRFTVCQAVGLLEGRPAVLGDKHRPGECVGGGLLPQEVLQRLPLRGWLRCRVRVWPIG